MIAKYDCKTPSEAAQILIDIYEEYKEDVEAEYEYILWTIEDTLKRYSLELESLSKDIPFHITKKVQIYKKELEWFIVDNLIVNENYKLMNDTSMYTIKVTGKSKAD